MNLKCTSKQERVSPGMRNVLQNNNTGSTVIWKQVVEPHYGDDGKAGEFSHQGSVSDGKDA